MTRLVLSQSQRALKKALKIDRWAKKRDDRRTLYFQTIDMILERLTAIAGGAEPRDEAVVGMLAIAMEGDESVTDHVLSRNVANPDWEAISQSFAGTMYELYLRHKKEGKWPMT